MFMIIKAYGKMKKPAPAAAPSGPTQEELLTQIRDLLKK
jgi:large conductance mechanosensitive channel